MAYTSEDQMLDPPIGALVAAIDDVNDVIDRRSRDFDEWTDEHLSDLAAMRARLAKLRLDLCVLRRGTV